MSRSTGELLFVTGSRCSPSPSPSSIFGSSCADVVPGVHSTNFSPIRDCGRMVQVASDFQGVKSSSSMRRTTAAFSSSVTSSVSTTPIAAPAIFTSSPCTSEEALSKIARTK